MEERRKLERFELQTQARVLLETGSDEKGEYELLTRDLSSSGAFLFSSTHIPEGAKIRMEFSFTLDVLRKMVGDRGRARVRVRGRVIRADQSGIAVRFESRYKITALENNNSHTRLN